MYLLKSLSRQYKFHNILSYIYTIFFLYVSLIFVIFSILLTVVEFVSILKLLCLPRAHLALRGCHLLHYRC